MIYTSFIIISSECKFCFATWLHAAALLQTECVGLVSRAFFPQFLFWYPIFCEFKIAVALYYLLLKAMLAQRIDGIGKVKTGGGQKGECWINLLKQRVGVAPLKVSFKI